ncbi:MAG: TIGR01548 family HAD-type hydrolase, partial [Phycisphaerales bacterium]|nr:TIGR01548 family HAD-type hydrolase [Phycisphaerales bacterium]
PPTPPTPATTGPALVGGGIRLTPAPSLAGVRPYAVPRSAAPIDLRLDGNEGPPPPREVLEALGRDGETVRRYPSGGQVERLLAGRLGTTPARVVVTAGADDALDRLCRAMLAPGRRVLLHTPTFEMLERDARLAGVADADVLRVPWDDGAFPEESYARAMGEGVSLAFVVTPNNPTGLVIETGALLRLARRAVECGVLLAVDLAYVEFADEDPTSLLLACPNVVVVRTLSKAWGLAGMRVGYAATGLGWDQADEVMTWLRAAGGPYAVSGASLAAAAAVLPAEPERRPDHVHDFVLSVRRERARADGGLRAVGVRLAESRANYSFGRAGSPERAVWLRDALAGAGIAIRAYPDKPALADAVRLTAPGCPGDTDRLLAALTAAASPDALLFDMDGVLADVSRSYRGAIVATCASYGVTVTAAEITAAKAEGDANNDWVLTCRLLARRGVDAPLHEVTGRFEAIYQGEGGRPGLRETETLIPARATLVELAARFPGCLGVVTGRPRGDALRFLERHGLRELFPCLVCMEDAPAKPDPAPVLLAMDRLGARAAWLVGDTVDDVRAARRSCGAERAVIPIGYLAAYDRDGGADEAAGALLGAGCARILPRVDDVVNLLDLAEVRA